MVGLVGSSFRVKVRGGVVCPVTGGVRHSLVSSLHRKNEHGRPRHKVVRALVPPPGPVWGPAVVCRREQGRARRGARTEAQTLSVRSATLESLTWKARVAVIPSPWAMVLATPSNPSRSVMSGCPVAWAEGLWLGWGFCTERWKSRCASPKLQLLTFKSPGA
jgi:hypothetical protein